MTVRTLYREAVFTAFRKVGTPQGTILPNGKGSVLRRGTASAAEKNRHGLPRQG